MDNLTVQNQRLDFVPTQKGSDHWSLDAIREYEASGKHRANFEKPHQNVSTVGYYLREYTRHVVKNGGTTDVHGCVPRPESLDQ